jgi:ATP/ADP translocase
MGEFEPNAMPKFDTHINLISFLLLFLFGGAIVGETVSLSMAVTVAGPAVLGKLFLVNGILLFLLPPLFFNNIDRVNRGKLLSTQLLIVPMVLFCYIAVFSFVGQENMKALAFWILIIYPVSYLSKTTLFLSFWTLANDIYSTEESKKGFPRIAAWGFIGGLCGACGARLLLVVIDAQMILGLWALAYCVAYFIARSVTSRYKTQFLRKEYVEETSSRMPLIPVVKALLGVKLVRLIALLYFLVFIAIFLQDYLFWKKSAAFFPTSNSLASFQFTYYVAYSFITIAGLYFFMPGVIARMGFTRVFSFLPLTLLIGSFSIFCIESAGLGQKVVFISFLIFQFARYVVFENAFSPVYQMFFAVIPREKRGRTKTFLEGVVKPSAIIISGLALIAAPTITQGILVVIFAASIVMVFTVRSIRRTYTEALVPRFIAHNPPDEIIARIGAHRDQKILSLVKEHSLSKEIDVRGLSVRILSHARSKQAFDILAGIFEQETDQHVREAVAGSLFNFPFAETRQIIERMLKDENPRVRANALFSLNRLDVAWKLQFKDTVKTMFFENSLRVQTEAAIYLWTHDKDGHEQNNVMAFLNFLLQVKSANRRSAGLYLVGVIKPKGWETILLENLQASSVQVFTKCVEIIFSSAAAETQRKALAAIEGMPRRHIAAAGRVLAKQGAEVFATVLRFMRKIDNKRMMVELVHSARRIAEESRDVAKNGVRQRDPEAEGILTEWILGELEAAYGDSFVWATFRTTSGCKARCESGSCFLEDALRDQLARVCDWALDVVSLLDEKGVMAAVRRDIDLREKTHRNDMIELVEAFGPPRIAVLIVPILRQDPLDQIAKTGKGYFHFSAALSRETLSYFVKSRNHWICLCALYCLWLQDDGPKMVAGHRDVLERLSGEKNALLAVVAERLLSQSAHGKEKSMEPFDLLERVMSLKKTQLFRNVLAEKLIELAAISQRLSYREGTLISREGELSDHLYVVARGSLKIVKIKNNVKTILSIIEKGETYGEMGLFNQAPRFASAVANEDCELWVIQRSALKKLLLDMPDIAYNLLEVFSEKMRKSGEEVAQLRMDLSNSKKELTVHEE